MQRIKAKPTWEWLAPRIFLDQDDPERPRVVWRGYPRNVSPRAVAYLQELRRHPYAWLSVADIVAAVEGPAPVTSTEVAARDLAKLLMISAIGNYLHHQDGGLWCWTPVPPGIGGPQKLV